jgi:hypothetical protein
MIRTRLSTRDRRALLFGTTMILVLLSSALAIPRLTTWTGQRRASAAELQAQVTTLRTDARSLREARDTLTKRETLVALIDSGSLAGGSDAAASAALGQVVNAALAESGVVSNATQFTVDSALDDSRYSRVRVRLTAEGDIHGLTRLLAALERGPALLTVASLSVTQPRLAAPDSLAESLNIELVVEGIVKRTRDAESPACSCTEPGCNCPATTEQM